MKFQWIVISCNLPTHELITEVSVAPGYKRLRVVTMCELDSAGLGLAAVTASDNSNESSDSRVIV